MQTTIETNQPKRHRPSKPRKSSSFTKSLFGGQVSAPKVFPYPSTTSCESETLKLLLDSVEKMGKELDLTRLDAEKCIPKDFLTRLKDMGLFGLVIPEEYGGLGLSHSSYVQVMAATSMVDASICATIGAHQSIGLKALLLFGTPEQKATYLPQLASGEMVAAFALTEPEAGSDAGSLRSRAQLSDDGTHYVLTGEKIWITNGGIADFFTVFAKTKQGDSGDGVTAFIVTRGMAGFSSGPEEKKLGLWGSSTTSLQFDKVCVPSKNVLGKPGQGFKIAMEVLNNGRLGLAASCAIGSRRMIEMARTHAVQRTQFQKPLSEFDLIRTKFTQMSLESYVGEAMVRVTARLMDEGKEDYSIESAICKIFTTEAEWRAINDCIQIAGGNGFMVEYGFEKILRDSRIFQIWEGANEVLRLYVALSGIQGPAEQLKQVAQAMRAPMENGIESLGVLGTYGARWLKSKMGPKLLVEGNHPLLALEGRILVRYSKKLSEATEWALRKHGKGILQEQFCLRRLADIAIDLYALSCTLSRASKAIENHSGGDDLLFARLFAKRARRRMAETLRRMQTNEDEIERSISRRVCEEGLPQNALFQ